MGSVIKKLPQDVANALDTPITLDELRCAVRKGKFNKVPRADGISHDLFKTIWERIKDDLLEIINHMYIDGKISDNQKHGLIVCVPKKPRPTRPEDFRHLTLLNADLKLMSGILANHISPWLTSILHPSQHCGIYGHSIFEAIATVREAISYTEYTRMSMCVLSIDFKKPSTIYPTTISSSFWRLMDLASRLRHASAKCIKTLHRHFISMAIGRGSFPSIAQSSKDVL